MKMSWNHNIVFNTFWSFIRNSAWAVQFANSWEIEKFRVLKEFNRWFRQMYHTLGMIFVLIWFRINSVYVFIFCSRSSRVLQHVKHAFSLCEVLQDEKTGISTKNSFFSGFYYPEIVVSSTKIQPTYNHSTRLVFFPLIRN